MSMSLLAFFSLPLIPEAARFSGTVVLPPNGVVFLTKFCYSYNPHASAAFPVGLKKIWIKSTDSTDGYVKLVSLDDQAESYPNEHAFWGFNCESQHLNHAARSQHNVTGEQLMSGYEPPRDSEYLYQAIRPRWWYIAVVECSGIERTIEYQSHMTNLEDGWLAEFPVDRLTPRVLCVFMGAYLSLTLCQLYAVLKRNSAAATKHPVRLLLLTSILVAALGMFFYVLDGFWFAFYGEDPMTLYALAKITKAFSRFALFCILFLLSRGICISAPLHQKDVLSTALILAPFLATSVSLDIWGEQAQSRKYTTRSVYYTWVGSLLILTDIVLLAAYLRNLYSSYSSEFDKVKQRFYKTWGILYALAFFQLPATAIVSFAVAPWVQSEVMVSVSNSTHILLLALLVFGLWPDHSHAFYNIDAKYAGAVTYGIQSELLPDDHQDLGDSHALQTYLKSDARRSGGLVELNDLS